MNAGRRRCSTLCFALLLLAGVALRSLPAEARPYGGKPMPPLMLHPDNPHYFLFRGKPTILLTSGEHYGAVVNLDFDYIPYLEELHARHLNLTRLWVGPYIEDPTAFNISRNTLAPLPNRFLCPWARSQTPGFANGGNKFDLTRWDDAYFHRLKGFLAQASLRGIVVEVNLFCPYYEDKMWALSPLKSSNNINGIGEVARTDVLALKNEALTAVQDALVRKIAQELHGYDNLYYEICNEPYFGGVTLEWQRHIIQTLTEAELAFPDRHLISLNIANGSAEIKDPPPAVSIFNFHYASPPDAVRVNYGLNRVIGCNETGFKGQADATYREQAWEFLLAGGGLFNHLDYSFAPDFEKGDYAYPPAQPGGGSAAFRRQMQILQDFLASFDFLHARPDTTFITGGVPMGASIHALSVPGKAYALYLHGGTPDEQRLAEEETVVLLRLHLPVGRYRVEWRSTRTGEVDKRHEITSNGGSQSLAVPPYTEDIAMKITRQ
jgi:hypothetical protein